MATATKKKPTAPKVPAKAKRAARTVTLGDNGQSKAVHFSKTEIKAGAGTCVFCVAQDSSGAYYGNYGWMWHTQLTDLPQRNASLCPDTALKFRTIGEVLDQLANQSWNELDEWRRGHPDEDVASSVDQLCKLIEDFDHEARAAELSAAANAPPTATFREQVGEFVEAVAKVEKPPVKLFPIIGAVMEIPLDKLVNHPANPDPSEAEIGQMAAWFEADGRQEEPIVVRPYGAAADGRYQILAGKRRYLAASRLGWPSLRAVVREDLWEDDQAALLALVRSNAHRHEDTPIRQAELLQTLIASGIARKAAGQEFGLQTPAAVSNKLALLRLPATWQERVISGEMPQSAAIALAPYTEYPSIMAYFEEVWQRGGYERHDLIDKQLQRETIVDIVLEATCALKGDTRGVYYDGERCKKPGYYGCEFDLTPELEELLQVVELPIGKNGAGVRRAINCEEYHRQNIAAIEARAGKVAKKTAAKTDKAGTKTGNGTLTKADLADQQKAAIERAEQLQRRRLQWVGDWLRPILVDCLGDWAMEATLRIYDWWAVRRPDHYGFVEQQECRAMWYEAVRAVVPGVVPKATPYDDLDSEWRIVAQLSAGELTAVRVQMVRRLLMADNRDPRYPVIPLRILVESAEAAGLDWAEQWSLSVNASKLIWLEDWLSFHRAPELLALAGEWKDAVHLKTGWTGKRMREVILAAAADRALPMPTCLNQIRAEFLQKKKGRTG